MFQTQIHLCHWIYLGFSLFLQRCTLTIQLLQLYVYIFLLSFLWHSLINTKLLYQSQIGSDRSESHFHPTHQIHTCSSYAQQKYAQILILVHLGFKDWDCFQLNSWIVLVTKCYFLKCFKKVKLTYFILMHVWEYVHFITSSINIEAILIPDKSMISPRLWRVLCL